MTNKYIIKILSFILVSTIFFVGTANFAYAQSTPTVAELTAQINALLKLVNDLEKQVAELSSGQNSDANPETEATVAPVVYVGEDSCSLFSRNLHIGQSDLETNGDVTNLQKFLQAQGFFSYPRITGFFGPITEQGVQAFQRQQDIVQSGSPNSTGYGLVGPRTRAVINSICGYAPVLPDLSYQSSPGVSTEPAITVAPTISPTPVAPIIPTLDPDSITLEPLVSVVEVDTGPLENIMGTGATSVWMQEAVVGTRILKKTQKILLDWNGDGVMNTTDVRLAERAGTGELSWTSLESTRNKGAHSADIARMNLLKSESLSTSPLENIMGTGATSVWMQEGVVGTRILTDVQKILLDWNGDGVMNTTDARLAERAGELTWSEITTTRDGGVNETEIKRMRSVLDTSNTSPITSILGPDGSSLTIQQYVVGTVSLTPVQVILLDFNGDGVLNTTDAKLADLANDGKVDWTYNKDTRNNGANKAEIDAMKTLGDLVSNPIETILSTGATTSWIQEYAVGSRTLTPTEVILLDFNGDGVLNTTDARLAERAGELKWADLKVTRDNGVHKAEIDLMKRF